MTAEQTVQIGANLVGTSAFDSVALGATGLRRLELTMKKKRQLRLSMDRIYLEETRTLVGVTCRESS